MRAVHFRLIYPYYSVTLLFFIIHSINFSTMIRLSRLDIPLYHFMFHGMEVTIFLSVSLKKIVQKVLTWTERFKENTSYREKWRETHSFDNFLILNSWDAPREYDNRTVQVLPLPSLPKDFIVKSSEYKWSPWPISRRNRSYRIYYNSKMFGISLLMHTRTKILILQPPKRLQHHFPFLKLPYPSFDTDYFHKRQETDELRLHMNSYKNGHFPFYM